MTIRLLSVFCALAIWVGCDPVEVGSTKTTTSTVKPPEQPFTIEPKVWGDAGEGAAYEVRELPNGRPGLFTAEGALLFELMPQVILDVGPAGKQRTKPQRKSFDLIRLTPHDGGGFSLFGKFTDENGKYYDLRVENGSGDPRVHVSVSTKWGRDVDVHRHIVVFRTGLLPHAEALRHDYTFEAVDGEFINSVHTPNAARFGKAPAAFTAVGRAGVDGLSVRSAEEGRWDIEFEVHHYENAPLVSGDDCDAADLEGVARVPKSTKFEMRADFILGTSQLPLALRFPGDRRAAVSLVERADGGKARVVTIGEEGPPQTVVRDSAWYDKSLADVGCDEGVFATLAGKGFSTAWSGHTLVTDGPNVFAPTEADPRRPVAFHHPNANADPDTPFGLFAISRVAAEDAAGWFQPSSLATLQKERGAIVLGTDIAALLKSDASATRTVGDSLTTAAADRTVWVAPVDELSRRLVAVGDVAYDFLPDGVVRVRNPELVDIEGFSMLLPVGVTARYLPGTEHQNAGRVTWFDLGGRREQLLQLFRGDEPFDTMSPAVISVKWSPSTERAKDGG